MSQTRVDRIERTTFAEVGEFLGQEWDAFDRQRWGEPVDLEKKRFLQFCKFLGRDPGARGSSLDLSGQAAACGPIQ